MAQYIIYANGTWERTFSGEGVFYVYVLRRPDGQAFYVGKGRDHRIGAHEREARKGCACHKCRIIRKIWREGGAVGRDIVFRTNDEREALLREAALIQSMPEQLANVLDADRALNGRPIQREEPQQDTMRERMRRAFTMLGVLRQDLASARHQGNYDEAASIEAEIDAYRLWARPPVQESLEGFE